LRVVLLSGLPPHRSSLARLSELSPRRDNPIGLRRAPSRAESRFYDVGQALLPSQPQSLSFQGGACDSRNMDVISKGSDGLHG
jgi:hypothetical protein